jgi:hypothetical protein
VTIIATYYSYEEVLETAARIANSIPPETLNAMRMASEAVQQISEALAPVQEQYSQIQKLINSVTTKATENPDSVIEVLTTNTFGDKENEFNRQVIDPVIDSFTNPAQNTDDDNYTGKTSVDIHDDLPIKPGYKEKLENPPNTTTVDNQHTRKSLQKVSQLFNNLNSFVAQASEAIIASQIVYHFLQWLINHLN